MKKKTDHDSDEIRAEYDLSKLKFVDRGDYAERFRSGTNVVLLDRNVREAFPDAESVNEAPRVIAKAAKRRASCDEKAPVRGRNQAPRSTLLELDCVDLRLHQS